MQACKPANNPAIIFLSDLMEQGYEKIRKKQLQQLIRLKTRQNPWISDQILIQVIELWWLGDCELWNNNE